MKRAMRCLGLLALLLAPSLVYGQPLKLDSLDKLASKATETVRVTLDGKLLQLATRFLSSDDSMDAQIKEVVKGLKGIYVRSFEFSKTGQYVDADVESIRVQLRDAAWVPIVEVHSNGGDKENTEVFAKQQNDRFNGLAILVAEPKELTVVHIDGIIDLESLEKLSGKFGIPDDIKDKVDKDKTDKKSK